MHVPAPRESCLGLVILLAAGAVPGQAPDPPPAVSPGPVTATMARRLEGELPVYPIAQRMAGQEGWVVLSFVVTPDGTVADPIVEDSSGEAGFERAALRAAASQRYTPATFDGKPVEQCATQVRYVFSIPEMPRAARKGFRVKYKKVLSLVNAGDHDAATVELGEMLKSGTWNHYEASRLHLLRYEVCRATDDVECMLNSLRRGTSGASADLENAIYREALQALASLEIRSELYAYALTSIDRRNEFEPPLPADHPLTRAAAEIRQQVRSDGNLVFRGRIGFRSGCDVGAPNWRHQLLRREFAVDPVEGKLDKLEIRCDWRRATDVVNPEKTWKIPASWGNCIVFVFGEPDATLKLVEYP